MKKNDDCECTCERSADDKSTPEYREALEALKREAEKANISMVLAADEGDGCYVFVGGNSNGVAMCMLNIQKRVFSEDVNV